MTSLDAEAVIVIAASDAGQAYDFVSCVLAAKVGINEDPVTGSSQAVLAPYWADRPGLRSSTPAAVIDV